jgi:hypothetical protein
MNGDEASFFCNTQEMRRLKFWGAGAGNLHSLDLETKYLPYCTNIYML